MPFEIKTGSALEGLSGRRLSLKVSDGWLVAFNAWEFGAGLWWFSPDGARRYKVAEAWINQFLPTDAGLLALEGLAHGIPRGQLLRLAQDSKGRWQAERLVDLNDAPASAAKWSDGSLLVATSHRLVRVFPAERKVEVILRKPFWGGFNPNSLVVAPDGAAYIGMRHGVVKLHKTGAAYKVVWLLPNREFLQMKAKAPIDFK